MHLVSARPPDSASFAPPRRLRPGRPIMSPTAFQAHRAGHRAKRPRDEVDGAEEHRRAPTTPLPLRDARLSRRNRTGANRIASSRNILYLSDEVRGLFPIFHRWGGPEAGRLTVAP